MDKVMNNNDLRRLIFSCLRKHAQLNCGSCDKVLIWDKKVCDFYCFDEQNDIIFDNLYNYNFKCVPCWKRDMSFLTWSGT